MYDELGRPAKATIIADKLLSTVAKKGLWDTVDMIVGVYMKKNPKIHEAHKKYISELRSSQRSKTGIGKTNLRYLGDIPPEIDRAFDLLLYEQIRSKGKRQFFREFFKRYPVFRVAQKI